MLQHLFNFFRASSSISFIQNVEAYDVTLARASPFAEFYFANARFSYMIFFERSQKSGFGQFSSLHTVR
jgi:hypothetical protein